MELEELHLITLALTVLVILFADHEGFAYMRGTKQTLSRARVLWSHRLAWVGLIGMIVTGAILLAPRTEEMFAESVFFVKMGFVLVLVINGFAIGHLSKVASERPFAELLPKEKRMLIVSGVLSAMGWVGAAVIGMFFL